MNILIIYNKIKDPDERFLRTLLFFLDKKNINYIINYDYKNIDKEINYNLNKKTNKFNLIITLGGDGTVIHGCKFALKYNIPILGINTGYLGFLTQLDIKNINLLEQLDKLIYQEYQTEKRAVLEININSNDNLDFPKNSEKYYAINDVVVARSDIIKLADFDLYCNFKKVLSYRADGLIVSTPTGSTAYSLAAGGPIVDTSLDSLILTPISSHSLKSRPIIFNSDKILKIISKSKFKTKISIDGNIIKDLKKDESVDIKISNLTYKFVNLDSQNYLKIFNII